MIADQVVFSPGLVPVVVLSVQQDHISLILVKMIANYVPKVVTVIMLKRLMVALPLVLLAHTMKRFNKATSHHASNAHLAHTVQKMVQRVRMLVCNVYQEHTMKSQVS